MSVKAQQKKATAGSGWNAGMTKGNSAMGNKKQLVPQRKIGRPSIYNSTLAVTICLRLAEGESLRKICDDDDMPAKRTILRWVFDGKHTTFVEMYKLARQAQAELMADEIVDIADDDAKDFTRDDNGKRVVDHEHVQRSRLKVDTRKWIISKLLPKIYGDKLQHTGGDGAGPVSFVMNLGPPPKDDESEE